MAHENMLRMFCWNINGIRAIWKKDFPAWFEKTSPDILCLQETKAQFEQLDKEITEFGKYEADFFSAEKKGYSGVATYSRIKPKSVRTGFDNPVYDNEGRVIESEYEKFTLFNVYFPNGGRGPERVRYKLDFYDELFTRCEELRHSGKRILLFAAIITQHIKKLTLHVLKKTKTHRVFCRKSVLILIRLSLWAILIFSANTIKSRGNTPTGTRLPARVCATWAGALITSLSPKKCAIWLLMLPFTLMLWEATIARLSWM